jgi:hypothetical protein
LFILSSVGEFLEATAALIRHCAIGRRELWGLSREDLHAIENANGVAALGWRHDGNRRVLNSLSHY